MPGHAPSSSGRGQTTATRGTHERFPLDPQAPVRQLAGIGPARERQLCECGVASLGDLLWHLPQRYEDRREIGELETFLRRVAERGGPVAATIRGRLSRLRRVRLRRRRALVRGSLSDGATTVEVVWFNRPYLLDQVEEGREYVLHGQLRCDERGTRLVNPSCEPAPIALEAARVVPVYGSLGPFGPTAVRRLVARVLETADVAAGVDDPLPPGLRRRHGLPPLGEALATLHDPPADADVEALNERRTAAHRRLVYGELFELQRNLALLRETARREEKPHRYRIDSASRAALRSLLPFRLTAAQRRVLAEIVEDLRSATAMQRLLQGDVGCGKTIVAALAMALGAESGLQAAFMAPTELLAEQHFSTLGRLLADRYRLALVTASAPDAAATRSAIEEGEAQIVVGTHALIQEGISFRRLGLAVVDEQHRFGVLQRRRLTTKGERPDLLVMTATPIPRSLALTVYGDLDLSVIDELPPGRTPVHTEAVAAPERARVYGEVRAELAAGGQAYVVFPLIEESRSLEAAALETAGAEVAARLAPFPCAVLHGRTPAEERERIMSRFAAGEVSALLATTVVEVGVDVARASLMVIESAERFGLSQLHQLRGRVGRGARASRCIALHGTLTEEAERRLEVFASRTDGFDIAEADLEMRGPGDLLGTRQAGLPSLRIASLLRDGVWLDRARNDAQEWVRQQPAEELARWRRRAARELGLDEALATGG